MLHVVDKYPMHYEFLSNVSITLREYNLLTIYRTVFRSSLSSIQVDIFVCLLRAAEQPEPFHTLP